jgi:hypothetical protein
MRDRPPLPTGEVHRDPVATPWRPLAISAGVGAVGIALLMALFAVYDGRLPSSIPSHFGANGQPDGWAPPLTFLASLIGTSLFVSLLFVGVVAFMGRSPPLRRHHGPSFWKALVEIQAAVVGVALPATVWIALSSASGGWPPPGEIGGYLAVANLVPLLLVIGALVAQGRGRSIGPLGATPGRPTTSPTMTGTPLGEGIELRCSSCGMTFWLPHVPILTPHMFTGGAGSLYLKCPRCGERAWDPVVRRGSPPMMSAP